jgi:hypothetical protein
MHSNTSSPSPERSHNTARSQEERAFMNRFKSGFTKLIKKGLGETLPIEEQAEEHKAAYGE